MQPSSAHAEANSKNIRLSFSKLDNEITKETSTAIFNTGVIKSQRIYLQKAKRITSLKAPSKLIQSYLKEDFREVLENRKRFSAIHTIFKQIKNSPTSDLLDRQIMQIAPLSKFIRDDLQKVSDVPITAKEILLSGSTIRTHFHHENVGAFDYYLVAHFNKPYKRKSTKVAHILYFYKLGHYYKAVFKVTQDGKEVFLQSLVRSNNRI